MSWASSILILALVLDNPLFLLLLFMMTLPLVAAAKVWREWLSFMKFAIYLCALIITINALVSYHGTHVLVEAPFRIPIIGTPTLTLESVLFGVSMSLRLLAIASAFALLSFTAHPDDLMQAMIKMKLPYKSVLVTSLSTKFIPTLIDDVARISDGQRSRGLELDKGNLVDRVRSRASVIIPLLSNSLDRAVQVAEAMESKAFGAGRGRTFYKGMRLSLLDVVTVACVLLPAALGTFMRFSGYGDYQYYPTLGTMDLSNLEWSLLLVLVLLLSSIIPLARLKGKVDLD
jgi:energy-coupling factor transport system permease protein